MLYDPIMTLKECKFEGRYKVNDKASSVKVIDEFFIKALQNSIEYKRCGAYFRSTVFQLNYIGLKDFFAGGGKIKLLINHHLQEDDKEAMIKGLEEQLSDDIDELLSDYENKDRFKLLATLVSNNKVEIRIVVTKDKENKLPILHEKLGIFKDGENSVSFTGGINETYFGWRLNQDSIRLDQSAHTTDDDVVNVLAGYEEDFDKTWEYGTTGDWTTLSIPDAVLENRIKVNKFGSAEFSKKIAELEDIEKKQRDELIVKKETITHNIGKTSKEDINLRKHQQRAIDAWEKNNFKAILKYCTGSGKTYIALEAIKRMLNSNKKPIIIVPSLPLAYQWDKEIKKFIDAEVLSCHSQSRSSDRQFLENFSRDNGHNQIILTTIHTAITNKFKKEIESGNHTFLVVDECHTLYTSRYNKVLSAEHLDWKNCPRLALSATPEDTSYSADVGEDGVEEEDYEESQDSKRGAIDIFEFFGGKLSNGEFTANETYEIIDAIEDDPPCLSKYEYNIEVVELTKDETCDYIELSERIRKLMGIMGKRPTKEQKDNLTKLLNQRARILKIAENKTQKCIDILKNEESSNYQTLQNDHWLIYVGPGVTDGKSEIEYVGEAINGSIKNAEVYRYYSKTPNKERQLENFKNGHGGICLACDMLDEGVDIPKLSKGIVMASSKNERQFIQRRGRLLRIDYRDILTKNEFVKIWDIFTVPHSSISMGQLKYYQSHLEAEFKRAEIFAKDSINKHNVIRVIERLRNRYL